MKRNPIILFILLLSLFCLSASAGVPLKWTVETSRAVPAQFEAYQGETLDLEAALQSYGKPLEAPSNYSLYWQTNGMGNAWWEQKVEVGSRSRTEEFDNSTVGLRSSTSTNVLFATWSPTNDVGAKVYNCFIGQPGTIYHAAFQLRLRPSPGATPNELPLPQKVIDFAKVTVLNPPWPGGGGGGVDTNAVIDIIHETVSGSARSLPKYLHERYFDDSYPEAAAEYYRSRGNGKSDGGCSAVRDGGFLYRNFDYPFDDRAEFVVKMSAGKGRFASVGVAQVGTNLPEKIVTSGKWSKWYKALPGATVDGINENGVACNINVVDGDPQWGGGVSPALHPLAAVRWILDNATNAAHAATYVASHIAFPSGWTQNFHYMVCDERETWIVENGSAQDVTDGVKVLTNFRLYPTRDTTGEGQERYDALASGENITSQWWTLTYTADGYRASDLPGITGESLTQLFNYWENNPRESHRGETFPTGTGTENHTWWQTVHTSVYDITNRVLLVAVQEVDDWYTFAVDQANVDLSPIAALQDGKRDKTDRAVYEEQFSAWTHGELPRPTFVLETDQPTWYVPPEGAPDRTPYWRWPAHDEVDYSAFRLYSPTNTEGGLFVWYILEKPQEYTLHATRTKSINPKSDHLATESGVTEAIAASIEANEKTGTDQQIVRGSKTNGSSIWDISVDFATDADSAVYDSEGNSIVETYATKTELVAKRDLTDNTCHRTENSEWRAEDLPQDVEIIRNVYWDANIVWSVGLRYDGITVYEEAKSPDSFDYGAKRLTFSSSTFFPDIVPVQNWHFSRTVVCTSNELYTTQGYVGGKVSAAVSTNNPAFVSAVRAISPNTIRTYDNIRHCWWVLEMVNGVPTWTVED